MHRRLSYIFYIQNWWQFLYSPQGVVKLRNGLVFHSRDIHDINTIIEVAARDIYQIRKEQSNATIVDAGAHIGTFAVLAAKTMPNATIHCIEPCKENVVLLKKNLRLNNVSNFEIHERAVYNKHGAVHLATSHKSTSHTIGGSDFSAQTVTLDDFAPIDILKLDVEGVAHLILPHEARITYLDAKGENVAIPSNAEYLGEHVWRWI